jgi:hypothetical protein
VRLALFVFHTIRYPLPPGFALRTSIPFRPRRTMPVFFTKFTEMDSRTASWITNARTLRFQFLASAVMCHTMAAAEKMTLTLSSRHD